MARLLVEKMVVTDVTAEKLMYDCASKMSWAAAINELIGEILAGCEISYVTAIHVLEAVLETDEEPSQSSGSTGKSEVGGDKALIAGLKVEDRENTHLCGFHHLFTDWGYANIFVVVKRIRKRLKVL